jgi:hypothetical protein
VLTASQIVAVWCSLWRTTPSNLTSWSLKRGPGVGQGWRGAWTCGAFSGGMNANIILLLPTDVAQMRQAVWGIGELCTIYPS